MLCDIFGKPLAMSWIYSNMITTKGTVIFEQLSCISSGCPWTYSSSIWDQQYPLLVNPCFIYKISSRIRFRNHSLGNWNTVTVIKCTTFFTDLTYIQEHNNYLPLISINILYYTYVFNMSISSYFSRTTDVFSTLLPVDEIQFIMINFPNKRMLTYIHIIPILCITVQWNTISEFKYNKMFNMGLKRHQT